MEETRNLVEKCHELGFDHLPEQVVDRVKYLLLDYLGVAARGALSDSSVPVRRVVKNMGRTGEGAVVIGTNMRADPVWAALANGTAAHSLELDDVVNEGSLHPGVAIMSAALGAGHIAGCSGRDLIEGIVAGYEAAIRLGFTLDPAAHYARGFHPTGTCGTMGSAITAAKILKLDRRGMANALGIAGSQAAASMEFLADGAFTKRLHPGWAAHSGIIAALLAGEGFTGPGSILEGKYGFLHAYSDGSMPSRLMEEWGAPYRIMRTSIKPHSCCRYKQGPIDGILDIVQGHRLKTSDIIKVRVGILRAGFPIVAEPEELKYNPKTVVDAQFSMPYGAAVAILFGRASLNEYTREKMESREVREMMGRISCVHDPDLEKDFPKRWPASVSIVTRSGEEFKTHIDYPKGDPENPLTWEELIRKFKDLSAPIFEESVRIQIVDRVRGLEAERDLERLAGLLPGRDSA
ncbi:MAG: MmgE/PrpD family protein [Deltaproteobacteria bacterium]|nr:MmgE/PrpD family protein [Deltaproteobacteria bacterium]